MHLNWADIVTDHGLIAATETTPHPPFQKLLHFPASHHHLGSTAPVASPSPVFNEIQFVSYTPSPQKHCIK